MDLCNTQLKLAVLQGLLIYYVPMVQQMGQLKNVISMFHLLASASSSDAQRAEKLDSE